MTAIAEATHGSTLLYFEPVAHFAILGSIPQTSQLYSVMISSDKYFTLTPILFYVNNFE
jgi:hypothetical protein